MSVTSVDKDTEALTFTLVADFEADTDSVWQLWADPRKLERWWGPPSHPATVKEHDLTPGGAVGYFMTGPEGETHHGYWEVTSVDPPKALEFTDGFADDQGKPVAEMPKTQSQVQITEHEGGTRMELLTTFGSSEQMEQLESMGMEEGMTQAVGQMDAILTE